MNAKNDPDKLTALPAVASSNIVRRLLVLIFSPIVFVWKIDDAILDARCRRIARMRRQIRQHISSENAQTKPL